MMMLLSTLMCVCRNLTSMEVLLMQLSLASLLRKSRIFYRTFKFSKLELFSLLIIRPWPKLLKLIKMRLSSMSFRLLRRDLIWSQSKLLLPLLLLNCLLRLMILLKMVGQSKEGVEVNLAIDLPHKRPKLLLLRPPLLIGDPSLVMRPNALLLLVRTDGIFLFWLLPI